MSCIISISTYSHTPYFADFGIKKSGLKNREIGGTAKCYNNNFAKEHMLARDNNFAKEHMLTRDNNFAKEHML